MKYKGLVTNQLAILENRLNGLKDALENNKPLSREEFIRHINLSITSIAQVNEKLSLEDDDYKLHGAQ